MNFFEHQERARRQSRWLLVVFTLAVAAIVVAVNGIVLLAVLSTSWDPTAEGLTFNEMLRAHWPLMAGTAVACVALIFVASLFRTLSLKAGGGQVARQLGGTQVDPSTRDPMRRRLYNVVEEMTIAAALPKMPRVFIVDDPAPNAFAVGRREDSSIGVTDCLLRRMNTRELAGILAAAGRPSGPSLELRVPPGNVHVGKVRFTARSRGELDKVTFFVDDRPVLRLTGIIHVSVAAQQKVFTEKQLRPCCQITVHISRHALASGFLRHRGNRGLTPNAIYFSGTARAVRYCKAEKTGRLAPHR